MIHRRRGRRARPHPPFDRRREHDDLACAARRQHKASLRRAHAGQRSKHRTKPPDFDPQARAMRFVGELRSECARDRACPSGRPRPRFAERACEREQYRSPGERHHLAGVMHDMTARIHDECVRSHQRFDLLEQEHSLLASRHQARSGRVQDVECALDLGRQRRDACLVRGALGPSEGSARHLRPEAPHRDPRGDQLVDGSRPGRQERGAELGEHALGLVDAPDQEEAPDLEITRVRGVRLGRRAARASSAPHRAPSQATPGRARRARPRLRRPHTARGPRPPSDRRHARHDAAGLWLERGRRAAPSRCLGARAPERRRAMRPASMLRGDRRPRVRAPRR